MKHNQNYKLIYNFEKKDKKKIKHLTIFQILTYKKNNKLGNFIIII